MSFKMDGKGFKKVHDAKDHAILRHSSGHEIKISKAGLSPKLRAMLAELPMGDKPAPKKMAAGGAVPDATEEMAPAPNPMEAKLNTQIDNVKQSMGGIPGQPMEPGLSGGVDMNPAINVAATNDLLSEKRTEQQAIRDKATQATADSLRAHNDAVALNKSRMELGLAPVAVPEGPAQPGAAPTGLSSGIGMETAPAAQAPNPIADAMNAPAPLPGGMGLQMQGIRDEAKAVGAQGNAQAAFLDKTIAMQQAVIDKRNAELDKISAQNETLFQKVKDGEIDPSHYMSSRTSGQRIAMGIAAVLGGMGGGLTHTDNPADKMLQNRIDADIQGQKDNLGRQQSLYSQNLERYKSESAATQATLAQMNGLVALQMQKIALTSQDPIAQARAKQAIGALQTSAVTANAGAANAAMAQKLYAAAKTNPAFGQQAIDSMRAIDPKRAEQMAETFVPGVGFANSNADATHLKEINGLANNTKEGIKKLMALADKPAHSISMEDRTQAHVLSTLLVGSLNKQVTGGGPMAEREQELVRSLVADPTKIFSLDTNSRTSLKTLMARTNDWVRTEHNARGLSMPDPASKLSPAERSLVEKARKNPNSPVSAVILNKYLSE